MRIKDPQKAKARRIVTQRLRRYVSTMMRDLSTSPEEIWKRVEDKIAVSNHQAGSDAREFG